MIFYKIHALLGLLLISSQISAQSSNPCSIISIGVKLPYCTAVREASLGGSTMAALTDIRTPDRTPLNSNSLSRIHHSERHNYRTRDNKGSRRHQTYSNHILCYYKGVEHELNINNLNKFIWDVGISNQLFVLAQAVLETGHFSSHLCREYNNLFGLYDSRHHEYYRFARWEDSVIGYQKMVQYKYKGGNYLTFLKNIAYAEAPNYTREVARIAMQLYRDLYTE